uniref:alpha/beta fold hydrolase n=1 Tax=Teichococcus vastitatis TaxID=2307076 RepID=UPI00192E39C8
AFDRPGYGYSQRPRDRLWTAEAQAAVLAEAFARLGIVRPVVVGHSWGTLVAMALALNHPEAVRGLVLLSGYYFPTARADVPLFSPPAVPVIGDAIRYTVGPLVGQLIAPKMIRTMFAPAPVPPAFTEAVPIPMMLRPWQVKASAEDAATMIPGRVSRNDTPNSPTCRSRSWPAPMTGSSTSGGNPRACIGRCREVSCTCFRVSATWFTTVRQSGWWPLSRLSQHRASSRTRLCRACDIVCADRKSE